jgi:hypothetical protein
MRIYIESTIPSYVVARPAHDGLQTARQQLTRAWWNTKRGSHDLFTSQIELDEIAAGELEMARRRLELMAGLPVLDLTSCAEALAEGILKSGVLPLNAESDAAHIALATVHRMDILLTWNCRHIANAVIMVQLRRLLRAQGLELPIIATPEELWGEVYD